jgi:hypothetical protein
MAKQIMDNFQLEMLVKITLYIWMTLPLTSIGKLWLVSFKNYNYKLTCRYQILKNASENTIYFHEAKPSDQFVSAQYRSRM